MICQIIGDYPPLITTLLKLQHSLLPDSGLQLVVVTALNGDLVVFASDALAGIGSQYFLSILIRTPRSTLLSAYFVLTCPYLIFVISFTLVGFSKTIFYTKKTTKGTKNIKNVSEKVKYMHFFHSIWKNLHLTENLYTDMSVVSVTNIRYGWKHRKNCESCQ